LSDIQKISENFLIYLISLILGLFFVILSEILMINDILDI